MGKREQLTRLGASIKEATDQEKLGWRWWLRLVWQAWRNRALLSDYLDGLGISEEWKDELEKRIPLKPTFFSTAMRLLFEKMGIEEAFISEAMAFVAYTFDEHIDRSQKQEGLVNAEIGKAREAFERGEWGYFYEQMGKVVEGEEVSPAYSLLRGYVSFLRQKGVGDEMIKRLLGTLGDVLTGEVLIGMDEAPRPKRLGEFWGEIPEEGEGDLRAYLAVMNPGVVMVGWQHAIEKNPDLRVEIDDKKLKLAKIASFLVRLSDDWGDREEDIENKSFNLLEAELGGEFWGWLGKDLSDLMNDLRENKDGKLVREKLLKQLREIGRSVGDEWSREVIKIAYVAIGVGTEVNDKQFAGQK